MGGIYKIWAPQCVYPGCINRVGYHEQYRKTNGTVGFKWKRFCEDHRTTKKSQADEFKMSKGCENVDGRYGFSCTATIIGPEQLHIHHRDGDKHNNDVVNLECLCANCHSTVTRINGDHLNSYNNTVDLDPVLWDVAS